MKPTVLMSLLVACGMGLLLPPAPGHAGPPSMRRVVIQDPVGDQTGSIDVTRLELDFDASTGDYRILLEADPFHPFYGDFRINVNLFDPDTGTTAQDPSFFKDVVNDFSLAVPATSIVLTGTNVRLESWNVGDRVYTNSLAGTGNPDGVSLFRTSVLDLPLAGFLAAEDVIAHPDLAIPARVLPN